MFTTSAKPTNQAELNRYHITEVWCWRCRTGAAPRCVSTCRRRHHSRRYLITGTNSLSSSSSNDGINSSIFLCGGISVLVTIFTTSDTLQEYNNTVCVQITNMTVKVILRSFYIRLDFEKYTARNKDPLKAPNVQYSGNKWNFILVTLF